MHLVFYKSPTYFEAIICPFSGSWHQTFFNIYNNKMGYKHTDIVVLIVQNFLHIFGLNYVHRYNIMLVEQ